MLLLKTWTLVVLVLIFVEDLRHRAVHWSLFAQLALCLGVLGVLCARKWVFVTDSALNLGFLALQGLGLLLYLLLRERRWVNPLRASIGAGDVLFLLISTLAFSVPNFIVYVISGLLFSLVAYGALLLVHRRAQRTVPMAGFMALYMGLWLVLEMSGVTGPWHSRLPITQWT